MSEVCEVFVDGVRFIRADPSPSPLPLDVLDVRDRRMADVARDVEIGNIEDPCTGVVVDPEVLKNLVYTAELLDGVRAEMLHGFGYNLDPETVCEDVVRREVREILHGVERDYVRAAREACERFGVDTDGPGMDDPEGWISAVWEIGQSDSVNAHGFYGQGYTDGKADGERAVRDAFRRALGCTPCPSPSTSCPEA